MVNKVIKRDGSKEPFVKEKIVEAISKAMDECNVNKKDVANRIANEINKWDIDELSIEDIQDIVEDKLMNSRLKNVAKAYIKYRYKREQERDLKNNFKKRSDQFFSLVKGTNEEAKKENSNKDTRVANVMRDYIAGFSCKEMARSMIPEDILKAHDEGLIHFHDMDYSPAMPIHNCELVNLEDMLQNGTVINEVMVEKPKSFKTACTVTSQISAIVSSSTYGGQSMNLAHLAPFVDVSRQKFKQEILEENKIAEIEMDDETVNKIAENRVKKEIKDGIQTLMYQWVTLNSTNGQAAFVTLFMYIDDVPAGQTRDDLVLLIEEVLKQRIKGMKNKVGEYVTVAFPKLIYVLDEDNIHEDSEYYWLTKLAAECSSKRLVPDYVSAKKMKELKEGNVVCPMGCVDGDEIITYKINGELFVESFTRMWNRMSEQFPVLTQPDGKNKYIDLINVAIYDTKQQHFVPCLRVINNKHDKWVRVHLSNGRIIDVTDNHPFKTENRGVVFARDLNLEDKILCDYTQPSTEDTSYDNDLAWFEGFILCDGSYQSEIFSSIDIKGEDEIVRKWFEVANKLNMNPKLIERHWGNKGNYIDLYLQAKRSGDSKRLGAKLLAKFGGYRKSERHIPNEVFSWNKEAKLNFMAGMIDADGHINKKSGRVQIGSTNKELSLQQMALAQSLGMKAKVYINHYSSKNPDKIRYRIEFIPTIELVEKIQCEKKKSKFKAGEHQCPLNTTEICSVVGLDSRSFICKDSYDVTTASEHFTVSGIYSHNCRSMLSPWKDDQGNYKFWSRFNQGVVTLNLVDVALSSEKDEDKFWKILDERLDICYRALMIRHNSLKGVKASVAPILWQHGALARLQPDDVIDPLLYGGFSTISLGYAGLYDCVKFLKGESLTEKNGHDFGLKVMCKLEDTVNKWKKQTNIGFALYSTPLENTTDRFAKCLVKRFGVIEGITDKGYVVNSYHVSPEEKIDAFSKLSIEAEFQEHSLGGAISYIETPNMTKNISAILTVMKHIYETNMYAEINTTTSYCHVCGCRDLKMEDDLKYHCPNCGNEDWDKMNIAVRVCGYISTNPFADGRAKDIYSRVYHIGND